MNKRGQIYIIAALILSAVIFLLISQTNFVQRILIEDDFEQISHNFDVESAKFMNVLLAEEGADIITEFTKFTEVFTDYVKIENPEFEFVCVLDHKDQKLAGHFLQEEIVIGGIVEGETQESTLETSELTEGIIEQDQMSFTITSTGSGLVTPVSAISYVVIEGMKYYLNIQPGAPQIIIISREEKGEQTKVYLNEEFITGEKVV